MKIGLLVFSFLITMSQLFGQKDYQTLVYQISTEEYIELQKGATLSEKYLHTLIDSTSAGKVPFRHQKGYFIKAYPQQETLQLDIIANTSITAILRMNKRDLMLEVLDSLATKVTDAAVYLKDKRIPFDKKTKTYRIKKWKEKEERILIKARGEAIFYDLKKEGYRYDSYDKPIIRVLKSPIRLGRRIYYRIRSAFVYGEWFRPRNRDYKGYIALNQPKYRPNDTLKIKGYFTTKKGRPLKSPLEFSLRNNGKLRFSKMVSPVKKGVYLVEIPLIDSLNLSLDKQGHIFFYDQRNWNSHHVKSHRFDFEEYQLDEVTYTLNSSKENYQYGEKVMIKAAGKFKTGEFIPDGTIRLKLLTKYRENPIGGEQFFDQKVIVKNVLWETELPLSSNKNTQILVPDSIFPKAAIPIFVEATFTNSNGEIQYKSTKFSIQEPQKLSPLSLQLAGEYITAKVAETYLDKNPTVEWFVYKEDGKPDGSKLVQLPHQERVSGHAYGYDVSFPDSSNLVPLFLKDSLDLVAISGKHRGNKINISIENPRRLDITYQLFKGKKLVESAQSDLMEINLNRPAVGNKNYLLKYQYAWAGETVQKAERFIYLQKQLNIAIEQPKTIVPGEQVAVKIKVKDQKNRAAKGVNLTAGAINGQFNSNNHFTQLEVPYKLSKNPKIFHDVALHEIEPSAGILPLTQKWAEKTDVDQQLFYQLRFPEHGFYLQYDTIKRTPFHQNIAQFTPYLVKNGKAQPIYLIYCNNRLVYYHDVDDDPPYAFVGQAGYNSLQLRTLNHTYFIDSVLLKKGHKLEISIDVDKYSKHKNPLKIRKTLASPLMTPLEKRVVAQSIFALRPQLGIHQIYQGSTNIHIFNSRHHPPKKVLKIGPFKPYKDLHYVLQDRINNTFYFEPHFSYSVSENRERLYEFTFLEEKERFPKNLALQLPQETVYAPSEILEKTPKDTSRYIIFHSFNRHLLDLGGTVQFQLKSALRDSLLAILWKPEKLASYTLTPFRRQLRDSAGNYKLTFIKKDSTYAQVAVELVNNELLYLDLRTIEFQQDTSRKILSQLSIAQPQKPKEDLSQTTKKSNTKKEEIPIDYDSFPETITGTVTDDTGEPLIFASVQIKGTEVGTVTDIDGKYTLKVPISDYALIFSYTGYATQEIEMNPNQHKLDVVLSEGMELMEVVVTGLSVPKSKKALGYGVVNIRGVATTNSASLSGKVAGVTIEGEKKQKRLHLLNENLPATDQLRSNFKDNAFWQPNLITNGKGEAQFTAVFPDNLTQWQTFVIGMDRKQRVGISFANSNAFKPLIAQLAVPRFMVAGDEAAVIGKSINFTDDSLRINTLFKQNNQIVQTNTATISDALIEKTVVKATDNQDTLTLNYQLKNGAYGDGEQRIIPIFPKGTIENYGAFHLVDTDTTLTFDLPKKEVPITLRIEGDLVNVMLENIDYLIKYPHGCNEQTASKLIALLMAKQLKAVQGKPFLKENYIRKGIQRLDQAQNEDGSWGWWKGDQRNIWMTVYVLKALHEAKEAGFPSKSLQNGLIFLTNSLTKLTDRNLLTTLELFAEIKQKGDFQWAMTQLDTSETINNLNRKLTLIKVKQANDLPYTLDTLTKYQQTDVFGNVFWGQSINHWYNTDIQNSLLAYEILWKAGKTNLCKKVEHYLLRRRNRQGWGNTFQTAKVLVTLLKNRGKTEAFNSKGTITLISKDTQGVHQLPFEATFSNQTPIQLHRKGTAPVYISAYQTFFNEQPTPKTDLFELTSNLTQNKQITENLTATVPAQLSVQLTAKRKAEYVMIEIPIPAGCSYGAKTQPKSWYLNNGRYVPNYEIHREYFKDRVAIYCRELPAGTYTYTIELEPRFTGNYTLNPAKAEEMYFPVFYGRNGMKGVKVY